MDKVKKIAIAFAEYTNWSEYERFSERKDLWFNKKSTFSKPLPIKTTEDLYTEFQKYNDSKKA